jgi:hypothetical protein
MKTVEKIVQFVEFHNQTEKDFVATLLLLQDGDVSTIGTV